MAPACMPVIRQGHMRSKWLWQISARSCLACYWCTIQNPQE